MSRFELRLLDRSSSRIGVLADGYFPIDLATVIADGNLDVVRLGTLAQSIRNLYDPDGDVIVTSSAALYADLRRRIRTGEHIDGRTINAILQAHDIWVSRFAEEAFRKEAHTACAIEEPPFTGVFEQRMYVRLGIVELWALRAHLFGGDQSEILARISERSADSEFMYGGPEPTLMDHRYDARDSEFAIRRLMTNAGFYLSAAPRGRDFEDWCARYISAIRDGVIFHLPMCDFHFAPVEHLLATQGHLVTTLDFPSRQGFYSALESQTVLLVTSLSREVEEVHRSGRYRHLWLDVTIPEFELATLAMPTSTYPNRPDNGWTATFQRMCEEIDEAFERTPFSMFMTSSGCYGLPLCDYVFRKYGCTTVHNGNLLNTLFGIRQNRVERENFFNAQRNLENWGTPENGGVPNLERIENGAYQYDPDQDFRA